MYVCESALNSGPVLLELWTDFLEVELMDGYAFSWTAQYSNFTISAELMTDRCINIRSITNSLVQCNRQEDNS